jgi:hypothetical protein
VVLKIAAVLKGFPLDRLDHGMVAFMAEEGISLCRAPKIKAMARYSLGDLSKLPYQPGKVWCLRNLGH